jgi:transposase
MDPKLEVLRNQGTANPRPQHVRDPAFLQGEFFDPRDLVQVKYEMLRRVRSEGCSVADAAASFGVSRPTFYKARTGFERAGLAGLLPVKRGPRGPHKARAKVMAVVAGALEQDSSLDGVTLAERVEAKLGLRLHPRTIERALARSEKKPR